ncbi:MAG: DNA-3-methyladenine glycosylase [Haloarculaceae archaeon]
MSDPHETLAADAYMGPLVEEYGALTIEPAPDFFERFVVSILRQQVSMASAAATEQRLFSAVDPSPEAVLSADDDLLRDAGLSAAKTRYVNNVAEAFIERAWSAAAFAELSDGEVIAELTDVTGVGEWTAHMQLMFSLGREDVFPVGDLGVRKGMNNLFSADLTRAEMTAVAERWRPYRSYASRYLWQIQD